MQSKLVLLIAVAVLTGCQTMPSPEAAKSEVEGATQAWVAAFDACDVDKITSLYDSEAVLWGTTSPIILPTPPGIRRYFERGCAANLQLKVTLGQQLVRVFGDTAINSGYYTFAFVAQGRPGSLQARYSFTYRKVAGKWLIADHHSSSMPAPPQAASAPSR